MKKKTEMWSPDMTAITLVCLDGTPMSTQYEIGVPESILPPVCMCWIGCTVGEAQSSSLPEHIHFKANCETPTGEVGAGRLTG